MKTVSRVQFYYFQEETTIQSDYYYHYVINDWDLGNISL
jgi:hypothetical protein